MCVPFESLYSNEVRELFMKYAVLILALVGLAACANTSTDTNTAVASVPDPVLIEKGAKVFKYRCAACHTMDPAKRQFFGPHLYQVIDRKIATVDGYTFTDEVKQLDIVWTVDTIQQWLEKPQQLVADMCMPFTGLPKEVDRMALLQYLTHHEN